MQSERDPVNEQDDPIIWLFNKEVEIGYLETGRPSSSSDKQLQDHKKLNRFGKDSIDITRLSKNKRVFEKLAMKSMLSIFTINVAGDVIEFRSMCKESGPYTVWLLEKAKIPLSILSTKPDDIYPLIHTLLTFRTAIACTVRRIFHSTDDLMEGMSIISESSNMSTSSQTSIITSPPSSPSSYRPLSPKPPRRKKSKVKRREY